MSLFLLMQLGHGRGYRRERRQAHRRIVSEIFSPPRITQHLSQFPRDDLAPGFALDLTVTDPDDGLPWDFNCAKKRAKARRLLQIQRPLFLFASPCCTAWCTWQALNEARYDRGDILKRERTAAAVHLQFLVSLYQDQVAAGRRFRREGAVHLDGAEAGRLQTTGAPRLWRARRQSSVASAAQTRSAARSSRTVRRRRRGRQRRAREASNCRASEKKCICDGCVPALCTILSEWPCVPLYFPDSPLHVGILYVCLL